jgi:hypothetical protein
LIALMMRTGSLTTTTNLTPEQLAELWRRRQKRAFGRVREGRGRSHQHHVNALDQRERSNQREGTMTTSNTPRVDDIHAWDTQAGQAWVAGDYARSRQLFEHVLAAWRVLQQPEQIIVALIHVTIAMRFEPGYDPDLARPLLDEALQIAQQIGTNRLIGPVQFNLTWLELDSGHYAEAISGMQHVVPLFMQFPDPDGTCHGLEIIAKAMIGLGQDEPGLRLYAAASGIRAQRRTSHTSAAYLAHETRALAAARQQVGAERSAVLEMEGHALTLNQAVEYALSFRVPTR